MSDVLLQQILSEMKGIKTDISGIKSDVSTLKSDVSALKLHVEVLNTDMSEVKKEQQLTNKRLSSIETKQDTIYINYVSLTEIQSKTLSLLEQLQTDVEFTYQKTAMNDLKINRIETNSTHKH
ncbi:hypothetical protein [Sporosarcina sp. P7]|uniref:hypothetical protein n=1 Tax=Sporosarcina sp. P7 TaxID=2048244 RepID=UPI00117C2183|nr:hypothetical protein [Sporosarcina sp. P7]